MLDSFKINQRTTLQAWAIAVVYMLTGMDSRFRCQNVIAARKLQTSENNTQLAFWYILRHHLSTNLFLR